MVPVQVVPVSATNTRWTGEVLKKIWNKKLGKLAEMLSQHHLVQMEKHA